MNEIDANKIFKARLEIIHNASKLIKYGNDQQKSASIGQMSLFQDADTVVKPEMDKFEEDVNNLAMSIKEAELIGVSLTYDIMQKYLIYYKIYVTHSIKQISEMNGGHNKIVTIGMVTDITYHTNVLKKPYIKMTISDKGNDIVVFLNGNDYDKYSKLFKKYGIYMFSLTKNKVNGYINILAATDPEKVNVDKRIAGIKINIDNIKKMKLVRTYMHTYMFKNKAHDVYFVHGKTSLKAKYKVNICSEDIAYLENKGCKVEIIKK